MLIYDVLAIFEKQDETSKISADSQPGFRM